MNPNLDAPRDVRDWLVRFAGRNPFGLPNWRVCLAQHVMRKCGGVFHEWPDGELEMYNLGPGGRMTVKDIAPTAIRSGIVEAPRYPHDGWIMERWMPAHMWGSRVAWESAISADGTRLMGPYPNEGDYWMLCGPFPKMPDVGDMEEAISRYECQRNNQPRRLEAAINLAITQERDRQIARYHKLISDLEHLRKDGILPVLKSGSLAAQRVRQQLNAQMGITSHSAVM